MERRGPISFVLELMRTFSFARCESSRRIYSPLIGNDGQYDTRGVNILCFGFVNENQTIKLKQ